MICFLAASDKVFFQVASRLICEEGVDETGGSRCHMAG